MANTNKGRELNNNNHLQPIVCMMNKARMASKAAPTAQKDSIKTTHLALWAIGKNSAYKVTLKCELHFN